MPEFLSSVPALNCSFVTVIRTPFHSHYSSPSPFSPASHHKRSITLSRIYVSSPWTTNLCSWYSLNNSCYLLWMILSPPIVDIFSCLSVPELFCLLLLLHAKLRQVLVSHLFLSSFCHCIRQHRWSANFRFPSRNVLPFILYINFLSFSHYSCIMKGALFTNFGFKQKRKT